MPQFGPIEDRFWRHVEKTEICWWWRGAIHRGYGVFWLNGRNVRAHRYSYGLEYGLPRRDLTLDHLCRNRACVRPTHLEAVTVRENVLRGIGLTAKNALRTHCPIGHAYSPDNLIAYRLRRGHRDCKECNRTASRNYQRQRRASRTEARS